ncbi:hypothetical protein CBL_04108 [Carabus blaptoides fortunei]
MCFSLDHSFGGCYLIEVLTNNRHVGIKGNTSTLQNCCKEELFQPQWIRHFWTTIRASSLR